MSGPRILAIMGSGETAPTMAKVHRALFERFGAGAGAGGDPRHAVRLPGERRRAERPDRRVLRARASAATVAVASYRSRDVDAVTPATAVARIREARYVMAGPGSPSYALRQWAGGPIPDALADGLRDGGILTMASAAALTLGVVTIPVYEIYKVGDGSELARRGSTCSVRRPGCAAAVVPHYDNAEGGNHDTRFCYMGERRLRMLEAPLPAGAFILGVDSHTALVLDLERADGRGLRPRRGHGPGRRAERGLPERQRGRDRGARRGRPGAGGRRGRRRRLGARRGRGRATGPAHGAAGRDRPSRCATRWPSSRARSSRPSAHGDTRAAVAALLDLDSAISARVRRGEDSPDLDNARATFRALIARLGEAAGSAARDPRATLEPFVEALLELRARARDARDWATADLVRDRLAAAGVEVRDDGRRLDLGPGGTDPTRLATRAYAPLDGPLPDDHRAVPDPRGRADPASPPAPSARRRSRRPAGTCSRSTPTTSSSTC